MGGEGWEVGDERGELGDGRCVGYQARCTWLRWMHPVGVGDLFDYWKILALRL